MIRKSDQSQDNHATFRSGRLFFQSDVNGRGTGWYIELSQGKPYGPFLDKDVANTIYEGLVGRLSRASEEDIQNQG